MKQIAVFGDVHAPYHNERAVGLLCEVLADRQPNMLINLGDMFDFYALAAYRRDPSRAQRLVDEMADALPVLVDIMECAGGAELHYAMGNHEDRLDRYIMDNAPALHGLQELTVNQLADLEENGWKITPYKDYDEIGKVCYTHDLGFSGPDMAKRAVIRAGHSVCVGHGHGMGSFFAGDIRGQPRVGWANGWLGDVNKADYMHRLNASRDWVQGFTWGWMDDDGTTCFTAVPIIDGRCMLEGKVYK